MLSERQIFILLVMLLGVSLLVILQAGAVFLPLLVAFLLAYLLDPVVQRLEAAGSGRVAAIFMVFGGALFLGSGAIFLVIHSFRTEFQDVQLNLPAYALSLYNHIPLPVKAYLGIETPELLHERIAVGLEGLRGVSATIVREAFLVIRKAFTSTLGLVIGIVGYLITPVYLYYLLKDLPAIRQNIASLVPQRHRDWCRETWAQVDSILSGFVRGQLLVCAILALLYSIGLVIIDIDLAVLIGTFAGAAFIIPYVGTLLGIILSVVMALLKFQDWLHPLLCVGWFLLVQALEGTIITPKVVGDKVGLHPVMAILALLIGGQFWGLFGMLLAVPAAAVLKVFISSLLASYRTTDFFRREA